MGRVIGLGGDPAEGVENLLGCGNEPLGTSAGYRPTLEPEHPVQSPF